MKPDTYDDKVGCASLTEDQMREAFELFKEITASQRGQLKLAGTKEAEGSTFAFMFGRKEPHNDLQGS